MILTLEQVRESKFHLARRNGYEPADVDTFVDQVEETLIALNEELDTLRKRAGAEGADAFPSAADRDAEISGYKGRIEQLEQQLAERGEPDAPAAGTPVPPPAVVAPQADTAELDRLREQLAAKEAEVAHLREQLDAANADAGREGRVERVVVTAAPEASTAVARMIEISTRNLEENATRAEADAEQLRSDARREADEVRTSAQAEADRLLTEAKQRREQLDAEHEERKAATEAELAERRSTLMGQLDAEHADLRSKIDGLSAYEADYRERVRQHLTERLEHLDSVTLTPAERPVLLDADAPVRPAAQGVVEPDDKA